MEKKTWDFRAGHLLRRTRHRAVLTQAEVAERAGLPQSTVSAYESGDRQPTLPMLSKLLEAMGSELTIAAAPLPEQLEVLTGPMGLRVRRHRQVIADEADRYGVDTVQVIGAAARGDDEPGDPIELLVETNAKATVVNMLNLSSELAMQLGTKVKIFTLSDFSPERRGEVQSEAVTL
jgi:predicted nucleotidyltransferase/DNA-binding XRE family transcriptional regulator